MSINIHKRNIDNFFNNHDLSEIDLIYGGVTEDKIANRFIQHVFKTTDTIDDSWFYHDKSLTSITVSLIKHDAQYYKKMITDVENYLVKQCRDKFGNLCINYISENENGVKYGGGRGIRTRHINNGDVYKFYICYKIN